MTHAAPDNTSFVATKRAAKGSGYQWLLTLDEWQALWSGKDYSRRGATMGRYKLIRLNPALPYCVENCEVVRLTRDNIDQQAVTWGKPVAPYRNARTLTVAQWAAELQAQPVSPNDTQ